MSTWQTMRLTRRNGVARNDTHIAASAAASPPDFDSCEARRKILGPSASTNLIVSRRDFVLELRPRARRVPHIPNLPKHFTAWRGGVSPGRGSRGSGPTNQETGARALFVRLGPKTANSLDSGRKISPSFSQHLLLKNQTATRNNQVCDFWRP